MKHDEMILWSLQCSFNKKEHMQRWAHALFSEKLKKEGFISYQEEDLSWYKVVNGEVLQTVYLFTFSPVIPLIPAIGYDMHPLFIQAPIPQKVTVRGWPNCEVMSKIYFDTPMAQFDEETYVQSTVSALGGAEKLDEIIFPIFNSVNTINDAYQFYKKRYMEIAQDYMRRNQGRLSNVVATNDFIDIAIYLDDTEVYPLCLSDLEFKKGWTPKEDARMNAQRAAIAEGRRKEYLEVLESRRIRFIQKLRKKLGMQFY